MQAQCTCRTCLGPPSASLQAAAHLDWDPFTPCECPRPCAMQPVVIQTWHHQHCPFLTIPVGQYVSPARLTSATVHNACPLQCTAATDTACEVSLQDMFKQPQRSLSARQQRSQERILARQLLNYERLRGLQWLAVVTAIAVWSTGILAKDNPLQP